ncbi:hypothetical protein CAOG_08283 [Capsaspora owczarzaki ATCC 30864]|uniref:hypothetical protein n=1 Tax=Capsaspora owczarzaki (strain ATCC 30864) TaxID=595528 RepID=UPI0001FE2853|nr:hypothetical protein CAOG_08283 [Capsaspora owczarzaki ATCC 30864]|eukprot:XP_004342006.1 hypothetical protein CAOG_08283 [Capsaspora owczarzaki ATCC 30864]
MEKHKHPLFGRKETKRFLTNLIVQFLANVRAGGTDRMQYPVALAATVPGCGKTRMCLSTLRDIVPKVCAPPKGTHVPYLRLFVTLNADPGTTWNPKEQDRHPEHAIAKRLLGSYFALPDLDTVANISVKAAMDLIRRTEAARRQIDPRQLHIFIAVDEATRLLDAKVNQSYRLSDHRSLPAVRRRRRFWSQALGPLQDICRKPSTPTWMMIAGTKSDQLTSAISTVIAVDSSLPVEHVPIAPLTGSATARLLDHVQSTAQSSEQTTHGDWRFKPEFMRSIQNVAGLPRSILAALKETSDTLKTIEVAYKQFLDIMSAVVALLTSSRMENLDEALLKERSFVLDRAGMDKFTAGFKFIAEMFKSAADLRKFLMQHANEQVSKTIRTKNGPVTTVYKYPAEAIPSKKVLQWPYALDAKPRKQKNQ